MRSQGKVKGKRRKVKGFKKAGQGWSAFFVWWVVGDQAYYPGRFFSKRNPNYFQNVKFVIC